MSSSFSADGVRGIVGEDLMTDLAFRMGQAVGMILMEEKRECPTAAA